MVIYTRESSLPESLLPRLREAARKVNFDFDKDFKITDNTCPTELSRGEKVLLREKFAGKVALQTEKQLAAQATRLRSNAVQELSKDTNVIEKAIETLEEKTQQFEEEVVNDAIQLEQEVVKDTIQLEKEVVKDAVQLEKEVVKDAKKLEQEVVKDSRLILNNIVL